jgi:hypothetical protein
MRWLHWPRRVVCGNGLTASRRRLRLSAAASDMEKMRTRFKASASGNTVQFVLGKLESKDYGLFGISKETGAKVSEINFGKDNDPKYLLDDISRIVYYLNDNGVLKSITY